MPPPSPAASHPLQFLQPASSGGLTAEQRDQLQRAVSDPHVFKANPRFEQVAVNSLGERSNSSIVPSDGELFIRTHQALWCIAGKR